MIFPALPCTEDSPGDPPATGLDLIGLAVAVTSTQSGFAPRPRQHDLPLFGDLRWRGWAAALESGVARSLVVIGGIEEIPAAQLPHTLDAHLAQNGTHARVPRGYAACHALTHDFGIPASRVDWRISEGHTRGNIDTLEALLRGPLCDRPCAVSSSHYHLPRAMMDITAAGISPLPLLPAEAFLLATPCGQTRAAREAELLEAFGDGPLARRSLAEIGGIADKLRGVYQPLSS